METKSHRMYHLRLTYEKLPVPGWKDIRNMTDIHSFYWIMGGEGEFSHSLDERPIHVQSGILLYLKPGFTLNMVSSVEHPLHIQMLLFDVLDIPYENQIWQQPIAVDSLHLPFIQTYSPEQAVWIHEQMKLIGATPNADPQEDRAEFQYHLSKLIQYMNSSSDPYLKAYQEAKFWMETCYNRPLRMEEIARTLHVSVSQLRKLFMRHLGISPKEYLNRIRNEKAKTLLLLTEEPMKAVADACGFADEFHFGKMFRAWNQISPARFRALHK
ncbi:helix-turn-helix transcriptional regulator [Paenibacillus sp. HWE-109]|uniref:helix-turn-helix transcriptional regulator n=1 Tax=Paenibacillus sp. HWE-109 TaxID=1306526 RepID=UPI001EDD9B86|nr:AraC family transcriptional regulator [Paenibacillus sp. HWE-109]UKS27570.1 helix-turn-helix transcriptional regulator [Paenibacillus sp. HWE-109]